MRADGRAGSVEDMTTELAPSPITGYRHLSTPEIELINRIKSKAEECGALCGELAFMTTPAKQGETLLFQLDGRWVAIGKTHLQEGFMALVRAVAKPTTF